MRGGHCAQMRNWTLISSHRTSFKGGTHKLPQTVAWSRAGEIGVVTCRKGSALSGIKCKILISGGP